MTRTPLTLLAAMAAGLCLAAAPAQAALTVTQDDRGDSVRDVDVKKVTTDHGEKRVHLRTRTFRGNTLSDEVWHLVDTRGDRTPDFLVFSVVRSEVTDEPSVGVHRIDRWPSRKDPYETLHDGKSVDCGLEAARTSDRRRLLELTLGRGCFRTDGEMPTRMRTNTFTTYESGRITDKVPAWRSYGRWVSAG